jgi:NAD(P)-dependent dehydrogenase (short-subunit alcohol dehydrogenase family)
MEKFAHAVKANAGVPDVVVNNAGIGMSGSFLDTRVGDWEKILGVNVWGVIHGARCFGPSAHGSTQDALDYLATSPAAVYAAEFAAARKG